MASRTKKKVRYAVVGLGHIAQAAVLPAFEHTKNSELAALVSDDPTKLRELGEKYEIRHQFSYDQYDDCVNSGEVDAVYIALPNDMHCDYTVRAAQAGLHVLCEKPMAVTEQECQQMIAAARQRGVKLMVAYRLHNEAANLKAIEVVQSGTLGEPRIFSSVFCMQVKEGDIRVQREHGGGTLYDIGIYCINAARYLFRDEPTEVVALSAAGDDRRFREVDEMTAAVMRFPNERLASFTCSFGAADMAWYQVVGTLGDLCVESAYEYSAKIKHMLTVEGKTKSTTFRQRDQFGAEITYFSRCILDDVEPEPSGEEGLADVRIICALYQSAQTGKAVKLDQLQRDRRPTVQQDIELPPVSEPELVHAEAPHE